MDGVFGVLFCGTDSAPSDAVLAGVHRDLRCLCGRLCGLYADTVDEREIRSAGCLLHTWPGFDSDQFGLVGFLHLQCSVSSVYGGFRADDSRDHGGTVPWDYDSRSVT